MGYGSKCMGALQGDSSSPWEIKRSSSNLAPAISPHSPVSFSPWFFPYHKHPWIPQLKTNLYYITADSSFFLIRPFTVVHSCGLHFLVCPFTARSSTVHKTALERPNTHHPPGLLSGRLLTCRWCLPWESTSCSSEVLSFSPHSYLYP